MEKVNRYYPHNTRNMIKRDSGPWIKHEDHISALREIFLDWPGEYPTKSWCYYFGSPDKNEPVIAYPYSYTGTVPDCYVTSGGLLGMIHDTEPEQWGPRVPIWRKI